MSSDLRLKAAVAHWGPRFVANGVVLTDFEEVTNSIASYDEWCSAWSKMAMDTASRAYVFRREMEQLFTAGTRSVTAAVREAATIR